MKSYPWPFLWEAFLPMARLADTSSRFHEITESENVCGGVGGFCVCVCVCLFVSLAVCVCLRG